MLNRKEVLRYLPQAKTLAKEATSKAREGNRLVKEATKAREITDALKGVTLHNEFPVRVDSLSDGWEVHSGCEDVQRSAYVKSNGGTKYTVTTYKNDAEQVEDGTPVDGSFSKTEALRIAKDYVSTGKKVGGKRGRVASK